MQLQHISNKLKLPSSLEISSRGQDDVMHRINQINTTILAKLAKNPLDKADDKKLFSDPSPLGRYKNFRGASSDIANYIKNLDPIVRAAFVIEHSPTRWHSQSDRRAQHRLQLKISNLNQFSSDQTGRGYYERSVDRYRKQNYTSKFKLPQIIKRSPPVQLEIFHPTSQTIDVIFATTNNESDVARYYTEAILVLRDRFNDEKKITLQGIGQGISIATSVLELLKKLFPKNQHSFSSQGEMNEIKDLHQTTLTIEFQVIEFEKENEHIFNVVQKYLNQLVISEKSQQKQNKTDDSKQQQKQDQDIAKQQQQKEIIDKWPKKRQERENRITKNYENDELETEGLHGFAEAFGNQGGRHKSRKNKESWDEEENEKRGQRHQGGQIHHRGKGRK